MSASDSPRHMRAAELGIGFVAVQMFDVRSFIRAANEQVMFTLTAVKSQNFYGFIVDPRFVVTEHTLAIPVIHITTDGKLTGGYRLLTLTRNRDGHILARNGW